MEARRTGLLATLAMLAACAMAQMPVVRLGGNLGHEYSQGTMPLAEGEVYIMDGKKVLHKCVW